MFKLCSRSCPTQWYYSWWHGESIQLLYGKLQTCLIQVFKHRSSKKCFKIENPRTFHNFSCLPTSMLHLNWSRFNSHSQILDFYSSYCTTKLSRLLLGWQQLRGRYKNKSDRYQGNTAVIMGKLSEKPRAFIVCCRSAQWCLALMKQRYIYIVNFPHSLLQILFWTLID